MSIWKMIQFLFLYKVQTATSNVDTTTSIKVGLIIVDNGLPQIEMGNGQLTDLHRTQRAMYAYALEEIRNRTDLFPGVKLEVYKTVVPALVDTWFTSAVYDIIHHGRTTEDPLVMILGGATDGQVETAAISTMTENIFYLAPNGEHMTLNNRHKFRYVYRLIEDNSPRFYGGLALMKHYNWQHVALISSESADPGTWTMELDQIIATWNKAKIVLSYKMKNKEDGEELMKKIQASDAKIIYLNVASLELEKIMCLAYKSKLYGADYQWMATNKWDFHELKNAWTGTTDVSSGGCTLKEIQQTADGLIASTEQGQQGSDETIAISGKTHKQIWDGAKQLDPTAFQHHVPDFMASSYDTIWTAALLLNHTLNRYGPDAFKSPPKNSSITVWREYFEGVSEKLLSQIPQLDFQGLYGEIRFSDKGVISSPALITQYQYGHGIVDVATYDLERNNLEMLVQEVDLFSRSGGKPTYDNITITDGSGALKNVDNLVVLFCSNIYLMFYF